MKAKISKKKIIIGGIVLAFIFVSILSFYLWNLKTIAPTSEGIYIKQPYLFGSDGVVQHSIKPGKHFVWPADELLAFDATPITITEPFNDIASSDNMPMDFRLHIKLRLKKGRGYAVYEKLGMNWYKQAVKEELRTLTRNVVRTKTGDELRLDTTVVNAAQEEIRSGLVTIMKDEGVEYEILDISIGGVTPPDEVLTEAAATAAQAQRIKTEANRKSAEIARKDAENAAALADQEYMNQMNMTVDQYIRRKGIENDANLIKALPEMVKSGNVSIIMGNASPAVPVGAVK